MALPFHEAARQKLSFFLGEMIWLKAPLDLRSLLNGFSEIIHDWPFGNVEVPDSHCIPKDFWGCRGAINVNLGTWSEVNGELMIPFAEVRGFPWHVFLGCCFELFPKVLNFELFGIFVRRGECFDRVLIGSNGENVIPCAISISESSQGFIDGS